MNFVILLVSLVAVAVAIALLSIKLMLSRKATFPHTHVGGNPAMQERGIACHTSQHRVAQERKTLAERIAAQQAG